MGQDGDTWAEDADAKDDARALVADRYEDRGRLARGASGEVRRVWDTRLDVPVVMKVLWWDHLDNPQVRARFWAEANVTASLQHPGIVPVHDRGELADGRLYFTMPEVRGQTLTALLADAHDEGLDSEGRRRMVRIVQRVCDAVAYAHGAGVVHRDLKPDNIMVGAHGEVQVMDWGLARVDSPKGGEMSEDSGRTAMGSVLGTPLYMSPEQARGETDRVDARSDVYALGQILHHALVGAPPLRGSSGEVWGRLLRGPVEVFREAAADVPEALRGIVRKAMSWEAVDRFQHAGELGEALAHWGDGARRRASALSIVASADELSPEIFALREKARGARDRADAVLDPLSSWAPVSDKEPGWELEDQAAAAEREARRLELERVQRLRAALNVVPDLTEAHARLARHYEGQLRQAEAAQDHDRAADLETLVRAHDTGTHTAWLQGDGSLTLVTDPPGAEVLLHRMELRRRRLEPVFDRSLGMTPLRGVPLARGNYLLVLRKDGHHDVRYPVLIERAEHWDGVAPEGAEPTPIRLPRLGELAKDDCYVPPGWFWSGGDPEAADGLPARRLWVPGFVMKKHPVTLREYAAFLDAAASSGMAISDLRVGRLDDGYEAFESELDWPVRHVSLKMARIYATWRPSPGDPWRIPHDQEWEKAARGVDRRVMPWGAMPEPTWTAAANSSEGPASPRPVEDLILDVSVYGVQGLAGNVRDWTETPYARTWAHGVRVVPGHVADDELAVIRGGNVGSGLSYCRATLRFANPVDARLAGVGFRLVRSA